MPENARFIVIFAHGIGSNSQSPRNRLVARSFLQKGFAILLPDLDEQNGEEVSENEGENTSPKVNRIASHLTSIIDWLGAEISTRHLRIGLFGGRAGAASALMAAAKRPDKVHAVVSRGGRPDLAEEHLEEVKAPTLMIVGSKDPTHIQANRKASEKMRSNFMLEMIQGASHLFGEPGKLELVASISCLWFQRNFLACGASA